LDSVTAVSTANTEVIKEIISFIPEFIK
jgi:hypothetical protein